jgi:hypothetical protein
MGRTGMKDYLFGNCKSYSWELMSNLPFLYLQKAPNSDEADVYVMVRGAGWKRKRFRSGDKLISAWGGTHEMPGRGFEDMIHIAHARGLPF